MMPPPDFTKVCRTMRLRPDSASLWQKLLFSAFTVCFSLSSACAAQNNTTAFPFGQTQKATCPPPAHVPNRNEMAQLLLSAKDRGFLWKISKNGHDSWLYGTFHIGRLEWVFPGPLTMQALKASSVIAVELILENPETLAVLKAPAPPERLEHLVATGRKQKLDALAQTLCLPLSAFQNTYGSLEAATLMTFSGRDAGLYPDYSIDMILEGAAIHAHKTLVALETAESQKRLLTGDTMQAEDLIIDNAIKELSTPTGKQELLNIAALWGTSNLAKLNSYRDWCDCLHTPEEIKQSKAMLDDRNVLMAEKIEKLHESGQSVFVAVGSLHMSGKEGLPALLQKAGYVVQPIVPAATHL